MAGQDFAELPSYKFKRYEKAGVSEQASTHIHSHEASHTTNVVIMYSMHKIGAVVTGGAASSRCCHAAAPRFAVTARDQSSSRCSSTSSPSVASSSSVSCPVVNRLASSRPSHVTSASTIDEIATTSTTHLASLRSSLSAALLSSILLAAPMVSVPAPAQAAAIPQEVEIRAVEEYAELEAAGKMRTSKALDEFRGRYNMRRSLDGRLYVKSSKGEWWAVRLDMEVPGALLLRDPSGNVFAVQTDTLQQIDLSDDYVCLLMFADGAWEEQMSAVDYTDEKGVTQQLKLQEKEFREVVGILKEAGDDMGDDDDVVQK